MTRTRLAGLTFSLALLVTSSARGDDAADARALVDKAIKAHGGGANLAKFKGGSVTFSGTFHGMGMKVPMTGTIMTYADDKVKADIEIEAGGQKFRIVNVLAGDKGWAKFGNDTKDMSKDEIAQGQQEQHAGYLASLTPLVGAAKGYTLAPAGEMLVNDKAALGVKVSAKGRRDVTLYFDKTTGLLVRHDQTVNDEGSGREVAQETYPSNYKDVNGTKQSFKFVVKRDSKLYLEGEASEVTLTETLDAGLFVKP
ncbi:hypothetical protein [Urbifossiella limnaea]|uniref:Outer membrane lipoprotein-sorting protein n=1 Tax=Urbifossiella limnaea TaxID=2528023 RepID=A0A517XRK2_9BACT|nr:hypothetical protein [Urbifossiella limnaea]QDU20137.1 hypothetical protein ETAA1_20800 [Urbifossiella limnaea]